MIVDAANRFGCPHRFVVTNEDGMMLFVCEGCGHRTDLLPVHLNTVRGQVVPFPAPFTGGITPLVAAPPARASRSTRRRG